MACLVAVVVFPFSLLFFNEGFVESLPSLPFSAVVWPLHPLHPYPTTPPHRHLYSQTSLCKTDNASMLLFFSCTVACERKTRCKERKEAAFLFFFKCIHIFLVRKRSSSGSFNILSAALKSQHLDTSVKAQPLLLGKDSPRRRAFKMTPDNMCSVRKITNGKRKNKRVRLHLNAHGGPAAAGGDG